MYNGKMFFFFLRGALNISRSSRSVPLNSHRSFSSLSLSPLFPFKNYPVPHPFRSPLTQPNPFVRFKNHLSSFSDSVLDAFKFLLVFFFLIARDFMPFGKIHRLSSFSFITDLGLLKCAVPSQRCVKREKTYFSRFCLPYSLIREV